MIKLLKTGIILYGLILGPAMITLLYIMFLTAYLNGGSVLITINTYGEALLEFILIPIILIISYISTIFIIRRNICIKKQ